jgi:SAM-dependent methyltransferase
MRQGDIQAQGSAVMQAPLWDARARDWAEVQQGTSRPLFVAVLERTGVTGRDLLDVGCGAGMLGAMAATLGACVAGVDAAPLLVQIAAEEVPDGDFRVSEMESLPFEDNSFDVITGINSFQFAADPVRALQEARRVVRCGGQVVLATWGKPEECEAAAYLASLRPAGAPPPATDYWGPFALSRDGALAALAVEAGLKPVLEEDVDAPFDYPDLATALRGLLSPAPAVQAMANLGEEQVRRQVTAALQPFRTPSGGYHMKNKFRYLVAVAE